MGCGCTMRGVRAGSRGLAGWAGSSVFSRWVSYIDSPLARRAGLSVAQHTTRCAGGSDSTHCHFETCPTSPLGQAPIPSLRHLAPPSTLPTQQLPRWQKTHPLLARRTSPRSRETLLQLPWPSAVPQHPTHALPCASRVGRLPPAALHIWEPTRLLRLVSLWTVADSQLSRKAVPNQPYPKPETPGDPSGLSLLCNHHV